MNALNQITYMNTAYDIANDKAKEIERFMWENSLVADESFIAEFGHRYPETEAKIMEITGLGDPN